MAQSLLDLLNILKYVIRLNAGGLKAHEFPQVYYLIAVVQPFLGLLQILTQILATASYFIYIFY